MLVTLAISTRGWWLSWRNRRLDRIVLSGPLSDSQLYIKSQWVPRAVPRGRRGPRVDCDGGLEMVLTPKLAKQVSLESSWKLSPRTTRLSWDYSRQFGNFERNTQTDQFPAQRRQISRNHLFRRFPFFANMAIGRDFAGHERFDESDPTIAIFQRRFEKLRTKRIKLNQIASTCIA